MTWSSSSAAVSAPHESAAAEAWGWMELGDESSLAHDPGLHTREIEEAYQRGFAEGEQSGTRRAHDELQVAMQATLKALDDVRASREAWNAQLRERLVVLAAGIAQWVVERTCEEDSEVLAQLARRAIESFPVEEAVRIRLHPNDHATLSDPHLLEEVVGKRSVKWIPDDDVVPGGCVVEGPDKIVDGRIDEALARIVRSLTDG